MTEDLLAFVTLIAIWKIVQVWRLKRRIAAKESQIVSAQRELFRTSELLKREYANPYGPTAFIVDEADKEWPEEIG